jgi:hypothetical protein
MAYDAIEYYRIEADFLALGGADLWDRVESSAWELVQHTRRCSAEKQRALRSTVFGRRAHSRDEQVRRKRNKKIVRKVRCCRVCRKMYAITAAQVADGCGNFCTRTCAAKWNRKTSGSGRPTRLVTIDGKELPLPEWARRLGITVSMVYRRMRSGMTAAEALTAKKTRGLRKRGAT